MLTFYDITLSDVGTFLPHAYYSSERYYHVICIPRAHDYVQGHMHYYKLVILLVSIKYIIAI